ncbi:phage tail protein [Luteibacter jiangsuensis]|uniref:Phage tail protein n=1 Tax=Luteibacter jiangsuensis TaxID=637577 RepID=A0ABX0QCU4_9GAMM|nr:phage tail protein [Luteibacter jiangsuensis]NID06658.1 phage tail protein [Luteibacter jiangsuensis]
MAETFTWIPVGTPSGTSTFRLLKSQFGDGYSQEAADGINNKVQSWPLQFFGSGQEIDAITAFLDSHAGAIGFLWTPPRGQQGLYKVTSYAMNPLGGGRYTLSATFEQKFAP